VLRIHLPDSAANTNITRGNTIASSMPGQQLRLRIILGLVLITNSILNLLQAEELLQHEFYVISDRHSVGKFSTQWSILVIVPESLLLKV
jgi:hypothetical protein